MRSSQTVVCTCAITACACKPQRRRVLRALVQASLQVYAYVSREAHTKIEKAHAGNAAASGPLCAKLMRACGCRFLKAVPVLKRDRRRTRTIRQQHAGTAGS
eukprot:6206544-Pleurochrysis_carterae.AAC.1